MKRIFPILVTVLLIGMSSCGSVELSEPDVPILNTVGWHGAKLKFNIECVDFDQQVKTTRSTSSRWQDGDVVYLLLTDKDGNKVKAHVKYDGNKQVWGDVMYDGYTNNLICTTQRSVEAYFIDGINSVEDEDMVFDAASSVYACYDGTYIYPSGKDMEIEVVLKPITSRIRFVGENGTEFSVDGMKFYNSFSRSTGQLKHDTKSVTSIIRNDESSPYIYGVFADSVNPSLSITHTGCTFLTEFLPDTPVLTIGKSGKFKLPTRSMNNGWNMTVNVASVTLDKTSLIMEKDEVAPLIATILPEDATNKQIRWTSSSPNVATVSDNGIVAAVNYGTTTITAISQADGRIVANCYVKVAMLENGIEYVDLGLPSRTMWATSNVGASSIYSSGGYYAWGETSEKSVYTMSTYTRASLYKNPPPLKSYEDVATVKWGGNWRMPFSDEFEELQKQCDLHWEMKDGVNGILVTGKNGNSIFFPAAGYKESSLFSSGEFGHYWSKDRYIVSGSLSEWSTGAYGWEFNSSETKVRTFPVWNGSNVRPVFIKEG